MVKRRVQTFLTDREITELKALSDRLQISQSEALAQAFRAFRDAENERLKTEENIKNA